MTHDPVMTVSLMFCAISFALGGMRIDSRAAARFCHDASDAMKLISVVTGCFNEEDNVDALYARIREQFERLPAYDYEHIFIDNASTDATVARIKAIAAGDKRVKLIVNTRNFGHIRSPIHALLQARGDAVIAMASDLQEPPELIPEFIARWEQGYRVVAGVKPSSPHHRDDLRSPLFLRHHRAHLGHPTDPQLHRLRPV
jgi:glycosyltransferase involved in cell wall biosynthesis